MRKEKQNLDFWEDMPKNMKKYLKNYGYHFNHSIYNFAVSKMFKKNKEGKEEKIEPVEKEKVYELLKKYNITLENDEMYDSAYLYSLAVSDYVGTAFPTEEILAKWIKRTIDDDDKKNGFIFNRWYADMCYEGIPIDWESHV